MSKHSAGLLLFRKSAAHIEEVLLVHPGGPYWATKDDGAWSIPKGEFDENEDPLEAAKREFMEETGFAPRGDTIPLNAVRQPNGKFIHAWAIKGDFDPAKLQSNTFSLEWPPKSGRHEQFPEVDRAAWFSMGVAKQKILNGQAPFLKQLQEMLDQTGPASVYGSSAQSDSKGG
jgi:predicted NUDIX family NTP pyrophosphohydrolase